MRILIVLAIVFAVASVLVVIPAVWLSGKIRDWVQEDQIQLEALKMAGKKIKADE